MIYISLGLFIPSLFPFFSYLFTFRFSLFFGISDFLSKIFHDFPGKIAFLKKVFFRTVVFDEWSRSGTIFWHSEWSEII
jgi:hypothetical protein